MIVDTPKVMTEGNWRLGMFIDDGRRTSRWTSWSRSSAASSAVRWRVGTIGRRAAGGRAGDDRCRRGWAAAQRPRGDAIDFEIQDIVPFGVETGEPVRFSGMFHPVGADLTMAEAKRSRSTPSGSSTREDRLVEVRVLLGRLNR